MSVADLTADPHPARPELEKILASAAFAKAPRMREFLRFIVVETLADRADQLKEYTIGVEVFGKPPDFDPQTDGIVRVKAGELRKRLKKYYESEGRSDTIVIEVPTGGYVPVFREATHERRPPIAWWPWFIRSGTVAFVLAALAPAIPHVRRWLWPPKSERHVAVLQFIDIDGTPANKNFCRGLKFTLTARLGQLERFEKLWFAPATEVPETITSTDEARRRLGVNMVIAGSVQRSSGKIRLTASLIRTADSRELRSRTIDSPGGDSIQLQDEVVKNVVELLDLKLQPAAERALTAGGTTAPGALELQQAARVNLQRGAEGLDVAIGQFQSALDLDPNYALAHAGLSEAFLMKYDLTKAPEFVESARKSGDRGIALSPDLAPVRVTRGRIYKATGQNEKAIQEFQKALEIDPRSADAFRSLGDSYQALGKLAEAEATYRKAIELRSGYWAGYEDLGVFYYIHGRLSEAESNFLHALKLAPDSLRALRNLGGLYVREERFADAERMLKQALTQQPDTNTFNNLSSVYFFQGRYPEAVQMMEEAVKLSTQNAIFWGNLARAHRFARNKQRAAEIYTHAIQLARQELAINPANTDLRGTLAVMLAEQGDRKEALKEIRQALEATPANINVLFKKVQVDELVGDREGALRALEKIVRGGHFTVEVRRHPDLAKLREDPRFSQMMQGSSGSKR